MLSSWSSQVLIFCVEFLELSHLRRDLSQAEKKITVFIRWATDKMTTISTQNDNFDHFEWNKCHFVHLLSLFSSQLEISHVLNGPTPENQHRKWGPRFFLSTTNLIKIAPKVHFPEKRLNGSDFLFWWGDMHKTGSFPPCFGCFFCFHSFENR